MNLSFREKSLWVDLLTTLGIAIYYASSLAGFSTEDISDIRAVMDLLWNVVVLCILVSIVSCVVLSRHDKKASDTPLDEREQLAELKATRYGYWLLLIGISVPVLLYGLEAGGSDTISIDLPPFSPIHSMVIFYISAELVVTANQLWRLRQDL